MIQLEDSKWEKTINTKDGNKINHIGQLEKKKPMMKQEALASTSLIGYAFYL